MLSWAAVLVFVGCVVKAKLLGTQGVHDAAKEEELTCEWQGYRVAMCSQAMCEEPYEADLADGTWHHGSSAGIAVKLEQSVDGIGDDGGGHTGQNAGRAHGDRLPDTSELGRVLAEGEEGHLLNDGTLDSKRGHCAWNVHKQGKFEVAERRRSKVSLVRPPPVSPGPP